jgi:hypothetical protein
MRRSSLKPVLAILCVTISCYAQVSIPPPPADAAHLTGLTTPVEVQFSDGRLLQGSGFFYLQFAPDDKKTAGPRWVAIKATYVVTAKHIIQPKRLKDIVKFTYALRVGEQDHVAWHPMELRGNDLGRRLHLCHNESVDVAAVDVTDELNAEMKTLLQNRAILLSFSGASSANFPDKSEIHVQPGDDVLIIGYPLGFFDTFNKLPVFKTGVLNTPIGFRYNGLDAFLLDFRYYEGSSGSLVISKPTRLAFDKQGRLETTDVPEYVFLGVYSGEEYWNDATPERADLGLGWYYYTVEEAIKNPPLVH